MRNDQMFNTHIKHLTSCYIVLRVKVLLGYIDELRYWFKGGFFDNFGGRGSFSTQYAKDNFMQKK